MTTPLFRLATLQADILGALHAQLDPIGAQVVDGFIGQGDDIDRLADGTPAPTVILTMGSPATATTGRSGASIAGARLSLSSFYFSLGLIAPDSTMLIQLLDQCREALVGTVFPACGEVRETQGVPGRAVPKIYAPARYAMTAGFAMPIGA